MSNRPPLKVVGGTGGNVPVRVDTSTTDSASSTILDPDGSIWHKVPPGRKPPDSAAPPTDGGGGLTLSARVRMLEIGGGFLFVALLAITVFLLERIDGRFDRVDEPLGAIQATLSAQNATLQGIDRRLTILESRRDVDPEESNREKED